MPGEILDVLSHPVHVKRLDHFHGSGVSGSALIVDDTRVGHLVSESMGERVLWPGDTTGLVEEFSAPQVGEDRLQRRRRGSRDPARISTDTSLPTTDEQ